MIASESEVRCMLIPLHDSRLLLPNAAVAEVIGYREPDRIDQDHGWLQGTVNWHQREVPVVDFECLLGRPAKPGGVRQRIAVCYATDGQTDWPLVGLVTQGIPRLLRVGGGTIEQAGQPVNNRTPVRMRVTVAGEELVVPDLDAILARLAA